MKTLHFSVSAAIQSLPATATKDYRILYADAGFEFGFGRAGAYPGHSHLAFIDLLFAPDGITCDGVTSSTLIVAPPRTYLSDVRTGDFAFLKFCPDARTVVLPEKVSEVLNESEILAFRDDVSLEFPWYDQGARPGHIRTSLAGGVLTLDFAGEMSLVVAG